MGATLSRRERLQIRLDLLRNAVRELEQELEAEQDPGRHRQKPKLRLIKGGLSGIAAWGVFQYLREHAKVTALAATAVTAASVVPTPLVYEPPPAEAEPVYRPSVSSTYVPAPAAPPVAPGTVGPTPDTIPPVSVSTPGEPGLAASPVRAVTAPTGADEGPPPGPPALEPTATPVPVPTPTVTPTPTPSPTQVWTQATARLHCLSLALPPGPTLNECVTQLLPAG